MTHYVLLHQAQHIWAQAINILCQEVLLFRWSFASTLTIAGLMPKIC